MRRKTQARNPYSTYRLRLALRAPGNDGEAVWQLNQNYRRFQPPRFPGAPPVERGAGPNSGPDSRELVGWTILLSLPKGLSGSVRVAR